MSNVDLEIVRGADFGIQVYWASADQRPFTVVAPMRMEIRDDVGNVLYTLATGDEEVSSSITYNSSSGLIQLQIPAAATDDFIPGRYRYDLFVTYQDNAVTNSTRITRLIKGNVYVESRVTEIV